MDETEIVLHLPPRPEEPLQSDCCGMGCTPCVFDRYDEELSLWEKECERVRRGDVPIGVPRDIDDSAQTPVLSQCEYKYFLISSIEQESSDSYVLRFQLPGGKRLGLLMGQHIIMRIMEHDKVITRQYTPISPPEALGYFDLLIKIYPDGRMSKHIRALRAGDRVEFRGPFGNFSYTPNKWRRLFLLAAGTGIAPMIQVIRQVISNEQDDTQLSLVYTCKRYEDLLLKSQLEEFSAYWNVTILYILTQDNPERASSLKRYGEDLHHGRLDYNLLSQILGNKSPDNYVFICGTTSFEKDMISYLEDSGISSKNYHKF